MLLRLEGGRGWLGGGGGEGWESAGSWRRGGCVVVSRRAGGGGVVVAVVVAVQMYCVSGVLLGGCLSCAGCCRCTHWLSINPAAGRGQSHSDGALSPPSGQSECVRPFRSAGKARLICTLPDPGLQASRRLDFHVSVTGLTSARDSETDPDVHQNDIFRTDGTVPCLADSTTTSPNPQSLKTSRAHRTRYQGQNNRIATRPTPFPSIPTQRPSHHGFPARVLQQVAAAQDLPARGDHERVHLHAH